jgi:hypothetical protein
MQSKGMSDESLHHDHEGGRPLRAEEVALLHALLNLHVDYQSFRCQVEQRRVVDMADGEMGSLRFIGKCQRMLGPRIAEAGYLDEDGVLVSITVNADQHGALFELDIWKADFLL